jgi:hypothetical protein
MLEPAMTLLQIDHHPEPAWRCESRTVLPPMTFGRVRSAEYGAPDQKVTRVYGRTAYCVEVVLTGKILVCWTDSPVAATKLAGINTAAKTLTLTSGEHVSTQITERSPTDKEQAFIQHERLIESNLAVAAGLRAAHSEPKKKKTPPSPAPPSPTAPEINDTILWHVQQKIVDELDPQLKSAPSASLIFTRYCRDQLTLAEMSRRYHWPYRTLKLRKAALETFLYEQCNHLTLAAFFVDPSIFHAAERQLQDHRARRLSPHAPAET